MAGHYTEEFKKEYEKKQNKRTQPEKGKLLKYSNTSKAYILATDNAVEVVADNNGLYITQDAGTIFSGPIGYTEPWNRMKFAGTYRGNPMVHSNLPSTINTPIPLFVWDFPYENIKALYINEIVKTVIGGLL